MIRKICVVTGSRADYGLLYWLMREIESIDNLKLQIVVTGMHLSPEFGLTFNQIEQDGFIIDYKVEMLLSSDSGIGISKSMGLGMIGFADAFEGLKPDLLVLLGDRFEIFSAASVATILKIPIAHLHGGETTEGAFDESFRHSITKMSHLHFVSMLDYRHRVIQLGEYPDRVFNVGAIGIDNIKRLSLLSRKDTEESIGFSLGKRNLLITFHPATLEKSTSKEQFSNLLGALEELEKTNLFFTKTNADTDSRVINKMIDKYVKNHSDKAIAYTSLGQLRYLSVMKHMDGIVGNSSSGLLEAPSFKIGTVNIGDRQRGRIRSESVVDCDSSMESILSSIRKIYSHSFKEKLISIENPYGNGDTSTKIAKIISNYPLENILKKSFYNIDL
jgi:GDP/UDP-N,N'-diacetylbacillosamine 2-epimerase (hydrolysing)